MGQSFMCFAHLGMAIDPIHVGTGGARLGRVDLSIVRDPATRLPKIPGSSLAGTYRAYSAMAKNRYPQCAGLGLPKGDGSGGHCGKHDCPICTAYGFARGQGGGFAGLAAFSDAQILLFPVPTRKGVLWVTCPSALRLISIDFSLPPEPALHLLTERKDDGHPLNVGWLVLPTKYDNVSKTDIVSMLTSFGIPEDIKKNIGVVPDHLFTHIVNSNLEVRTSVAINPETGAAEDKALFTYEALPRTTFVYWEVICKNPKHFRVNGQEVSLNTIEDIYSIVKTAHSFIEHLGIGGMGTRGMGRIRVFANTP